MDSPLALLGFLSIFHVIGALAMASGLRGVWYWLRDRERGPGNAVFFIVWGAGFGCLPFAFGLGLESDKETGTPLVLLGQVIIWGVVFLVALLFWDEAVDWIRPFLDTNVFLVGFGGIFMLVGAVVASLIIRDELLFGLLFGSIFMLVGGLIFALGVRNLLKEIGW